MSIKVGLWIDHRKAVVVAVTEKGEETIEITSEVEKQLRRAGEPPLGGAYESRQMPADDKRQRAYTGQLNNYYDTVIEEIRDADSILIFGPSEAKNELKERLAGNNLSELIVGIETVDKMTNPQIAAKTRKYFAEQHSLVELNQET
jgi:molybdopterin converting factor small subunit